jgi:hypothetical protein
MKIDLIELLRQREIVHPTRIVAVEGGHRRLRISVAGYPWWRDGVSDGEERIVFSFEGIDEGLLDAATLLHMEDDEALELCSVSPLSEEGWAAGGTSYATYCSGPLADPLRLYAVVEDYLWDADSPRSARDFLNVPDGRLARFCEISGTSSYLVADAPQAIHSIITAELQRQAVPHTVLVNERRSSHGLFVRIGGTSFVCERATAEPFA